MSPQPSYKRTQYLVDRAYQLRFVTRLFMAVLAVAVASSLIASTLLWRQLYQPELGSTSTLATGLVAVASTLLVELLLAIPLVFILGIRQSHRIVGPMKRIQKTLEAIGRGDFSQRITLRQGDVLWELAASINRMAEALQQRQSGGS
ncbi:MAG: HAMP domain-containing protein [Gammaproteobacteria bacterium]